MRQKVYENAIEFFLCWLSTEGLAWGVTLRVVSMPSEAQLEEAIFSFASRCQLQIASWLWVGKLMSTTPSQHWDLSVLNLCRPCACCPHLCEFKCASFLLCLEDSFLEVIYQYFWLLQSFCLPSHRAPWGERFDEEIIFRTECSKGVSHSLTLFNCGSLYLYLSTAGGSFPDDDWARHCSMGTAEC